jgi:hypothetical protein
MQNSSRFAEVDGRVYPITPTFHEERLILSLWQLPGRALKTALHVQVGALSFLRRRFEEDVKLIERLSRSTGLVDAYDICSDYMVDTAAEYTDEAARIISIGSKETGDIEKTSYKDANQVPTRIAEKSVA